MTKIMLLLVILLLILLDSINCINNNRNDIGSYQDKSYKKRYGSSSNSGSRNSGRSNSNNHLHESGNSYQQYDQQYDQKYDNNQPYDQSKFNDYGDPKDQGGSMYDRDGSSSPMYDKDPIRKRRNDIVSQYMASTPSKLIVILSSFVSYYLLSSFLLKMIFSKAPFYLSICIAAMSSLSCFINGNFAEFTKALGVCMILLVRRAKIRTFFTLFLKQVMSATMLSRRQSFPPSENPWKYAPRPDTNDIEFSMIRVLMAIIIFGGIAGSIVSGPIPLFPGWLGALIGAAGFGVISTTHDSRGDLLRYIGWALNNTLGDIFKAAADVQLYDKSSVVLSNAFAFGNKLDQKYKVIEKLKAIITIIISTVLKMFSKVKQDYEAANN